MRRETLGIVVGADLRAGTDEAAAVFLRQPGEFGVVRALGTGHSGSESRPRRGDDHLGALAAAEGPQVVGVRRQIEDASRSSPSARRLGWAAHRGWECSCIRRGGVAHNVSAAMPSLANGEGRRAIGWYQGDREFWQADRKAPATRRPETSIMQRPRRQSPRTGLRVKLSLSLASAGTASGEVTGR